MPRYSTIYYLKLIIKLFGYLAYPFRFFHDLQGSQLRGSEDSRIECIRRHFKAISDNGYIYDVAKDYKSLYDIVTK